MGSWLLPTLKWLAAYLLGLTQNLHASHLWESRKNRARRRQLDSLLGTWIEVNNLLEDRPISICKFYLSPKDKKLRFDGTSFDSNTVEIYNWWSVVLRIDDHNRMAYVYDTERIKDSKRSTGFGIISFILDTSNNHFDVSTGYFLNSEEGRKRHIQMRRFAEIMELFKFKLDENDREDQRRLVKTLMKNRQRPEVVKAFRFDQV